MKTIGRLFLYLSVKKEDIMRDFLRDFHTNFPNWFFNRTRLKYWNFCLPTFWIGNLVSLWKWKNSTLIFILNQTYSSVSYFLSNKEKEGTCEAKLKPKDSMEASNFDEVLEFSALRQNELRKLWEMISKKSEFVIMNSEGIISQIFKKKYEISKCTGCY